MTGTHDQLTLSGDVLGAEGGARSVSGQLGLTPVHVWLAPDLAEDLESDGGPIALHLPTLEAISRRKIEIGDYEVAADQPAGSNTVLITIEPQDWSG